uniref:Uncharacterized protein n=1 Tax=Anguilla anguilla TaxID=7936 RepID=A0A0E9X0V7_ANGAN
MSENMLERTQTISYTRRARQLKKTLAYVMGPSPEASSQVEDISNVLIDDRASNRKPLEQNRKRRDRSPLPIINGYREVLCNAMN